MPNSPPLPNSGVQLPTVDGDPGIWGSENNNLHTTWDGLIQPAILPMVSSDIFLTAGASVVTLVPVTTGTGQIKVNLPSASGPGCRLYIIVKMDAQIFPGSILIVGTINGGANYLIQNQYQYVWLLGNGSTYTIVGGGNG